MRIDQNLKVVRDGQWIVGNKGDYQYVLITENRRGAFLVDLMGSDGMPVRAREIEVDTLVEARAIAGFMLDLRSWGGCTSV